MKKNLITIQSTDLVVRKSNISLSIIDNILSRNVSLSTEVDENWIEKLWAWADDNGIADLEWDDTVFSIRSDRDGGYWKGLPRYW